MVLCTWTYCTTLLYWFIGALDQRRQDNIIFKQLSCYRFVGALYQSRQVNIIFEVQSTGIFVEKYFSDNYKVQSTAIF